MPIKVSSSLFIFLLAFLVFQNVSGESLRETEDLEDDMIDEIQKELEELYTIKHKDEIATGVATDRWFFGCIDLIGSSICRRGRLLCRVPGFHGSIRMIKSMCKKTCGKC